MGRFRMVVRLEFDGEFAGEYQYVEPLGEDQPVSSLMLEGGPICISTKRLGPNPPQELILTLEEPGEGEVEIDVDEP